MSNCFSSVVAVLVVPIVVSVPVPVWLIVLPVIISKGFIPEVTPVIKPSASYRSK